MWYDKILHQFCLSFTELKRSPGLNLDDVSSSQWIADSNFCTHILIYPLVKYAERTKTLVLMEEFVKSIMNCVDWCQFTGQNVFQNLRLTYKHLKRPT